MARFQRQNWGGIGGGSRTSMNWKSWHADRVTLRGFDLWSYWKTCLILRYEHNWFPRERRFNPGVSSLLCRFHTYQIGAVSRHQWSDSEKAKWPGLNYVGSWQGSKCENMSVQPFQKQFSHLNVYDVMSVYSGEHLLFCPGCCWVCPPQHPLFVSVCIHPLLFGTTKRGLEQDPEQALYPIRGPKGILPHIRCCISIHASSSPLVTFSKPNSIQGHRWC